MSAPAFRSVVITSGLGLFHGGGHKRSQACVVPSLDIRASLQERGDHVGVRVVPGSPMSARYGRSRPPSLNVRACLQENRDHLGILICLGGGHQGSHVVFVPSIHVRALADGGLYILRRSSSYKLKEVLRSGFILRPVEDRQPAIRNGAIASVSTVTTTLRDVALFVIVSISCPPFTQKSCGQMNNVSDHDGYPHNALGSKCGPELQDWRCVG